MNQYSEQENEKTRILSPIKFSFGLLTFALLLNGLILSGLISANIEAIFNGQFSKPLYFAAITFAGTIAAWLLVIYRFRGFKRDILETEAERKTTEKALKS